MKRLGLAFALAFVVAATLATSATERTEKSGHVRTEIARKTGLEAAQNTTMCHIDCSTRPDPLPFPVSGLEECLAMCEIICLEQCEPVDPWQF